MRHISLLVLLFICSASWGQSRYWIRFTDKGDLLQSQAQVALSPRAIANRVRQGIALDASDYPVSARYLDQLQTLGIEVKRVSRWLNGVSAELNPTQRRQLEALPFVQHIQPVAWSAGISEQTGTQDDNCPDISDTDTHLRQLSMVGLDDLHRSGYTGKGVLVAVFDNGFRGVDTLGAFRHLFLEGRILATKDYVDNDTDVFETCIHCRHGTNVFSILAAKLPGQLMGSAPDASYLLLRTENDYSETHQEEDNWIAAAEFADSMGAQVFTTSLGYFAFDAGEGDYTNADLDGNTALITIAADMAADKGIVVVNSAGNEGTRGLVSPADGNGVIAVGAVDQCETLAAFSSRGPSADGRIKPDISAMGLHTFISLPDGRVVRGNGTSFSCPVVSGLAACLVQAAPQASRDQLYQALIESASQFNTPDNAYGYGIPNGAKALELLTNQILTENAYEDPFRRKNIVLYPNPTSGWIYLAFEADFPDGPVLVEIIDIRGQIVREVEGTIAVGEIPVFLPSPIQNGFYTVRISNDSFVYLEKLIVIR